MNTPPSCPKCGHPVEAPQSSCPRCGVVFAKLLASRSSPSSLPPRGPRPAANGQRSSNPAEQRQGQIQISRPGAILIGVFTALPAINMFVFLVLFFFSFIVTPATSGEEGVLNSVGQFMMAATFATILIGWVLLVFYIVHVFKNPALAGDKRAIWAVVLFLGGPIAMPVYWFLYVWRTPASAVPALPPIPVAGGAG